ncbi:MAG TPA: RDD family protein, partial [Vicinamibacterales bacterium]|nr:RDD family protein [Vicinamibacterales bacterium]
GQTIGKMAFGLKVVSVEGRMSAFTAFVRSAGCLLSAATLGAGLAPALFGGRALHDRLAGTTVVSARE